jgi:release factor glutamine methyltransferase
MDVQSILQSFTQEIKSDSATLDAHVLLAHVLGRSRTWVLAHPEARLSQKQESALKALLARIEGGEPLPHILGHWEFFGMDFDITPDVLIPRPETELLVERALEWLLSHPDQHRVMDVGTGSGCIAVALASRVPGLRVVATDLSIKALDVARCNAIKFGGAHQIAYVQCDLVPPRPKSLPTADQFDLIVANLPYIPTKTLEGLEVYRREPTLALDGGADGMDLIRRLVAEAPGWLAPAGAMMLEIEASQGMTAVALIYDTFPNATIHLTRDLAGHDRLLDIQTHADPAFAG